MNERIHRVLDGELSRDSLSPEELTVLAQLEKAIGAAERGVPRHIAPDLTESVMARIAALDAPDPKAAEQEEAARIRSRQTRVGIGGRLLAALDWLWRPRPIAVRPAWALGAAVLAFALLAEVPRTTEAPQTAAAPAVAPTAEIYVSFRLDAPEATTVHLAGDFTEWEPRYELHQTQPGVWSVVVPLEAGVHDYAFVIDGERWTPDPLATRVDDGFGGENSRLSLLAPERQA